MCLYHIGKQTGEILSGAVCHCTQYRVTHASAYHCQIIPNSSYLNPVDYSVWSVLQGRVYRTKISDVDELKRRINNEWALFRITQILNVLSANSVSVYALAFVL